MKTITKLLCLLAFIAITTKSYAQQETVTHYYYTTIYLEGKTIGVTPVISSTVKKYTYVSSCMRGLEMYLMDYIPAETNYEIDYSVNKNMLSGSGSTYTDAERFRLREIKQFKDLGYSIVHLNYLSYDCE